MIQAYRFGYMKVFNKEFSRDVIVTANDAFSRSELKKDYEGHFISAEEIEKLIEKFNPEVIVVGLGAYGVAKLDQKAKKIAEEKGIELFSAVTEKASQKFNELLKENKKVVGVFHLTC